jgi:uncharacterized RDD family membrane protein YckC
VNNPSPVALPPPIGEYEYAGFWLRLLAFSVDSLWVTLVVAVVGALFETSNPEVDRFFRDPEHVSVAGLQAALVPSATDVIIQVVLPVLLLTGFWLVRNTTPGKSMLHLRIVDAETGGAPTRRQLLIRGLGYYVSAFGLLLGFAWIGIDPRKQGWHDKMAGTVVVRPRLSNTGPVRLPGSKTP